MSGFKEPSFADRQKAAQQARQNILNKFRSQPGPDDPAVMQRQAEREAQAAERAKAKLAREAAKAEQRRLEEEAAAEAAAKLAREKEEAAARELALEAERKAARDARYAARKERNQPTCEIGIGVHSGDVLHGFVGTQERLEFTVVGDAVNRASRFCSAAGANEIIVSSEFLKHVWRDVEVESRDVPTKHEGTWAAFRVLRTKQPR